MNWICLLLVITGCLPLAVVLYKMYRVSHLKKTGVFTTGIVKQADGISQRNLNSIVIEYTEKHTGRLISGKIPVGGNPYQPGDRLPLYYDPGHPHQFVLDAGKSFIILLVFTFLIAGIFIAACFMLQDL